MSDNEVVAAARNADGRLEVFGLGTDNALWHDWQTTPGGAWSGWSSLGGGWSSWAPLDGTITSDPVVTNDQDGRLEAFAHGTDSALWHVWRTAPNGNWSSWSSLSGILQTV